ncbi:hypothetical protein DUI87_00112 [Hirundo rustica rustica]|uniref:Uncharacterized protein n=1 Tax=Hirundo rustica rustica TaxID=333673 RepID=A0A3M0LCH5_HIRRU|nr:hypothetical protein DUI87_00112 [Hirundo rustica rustica]
MSPQEVTMASERLRSAQDLLDLTFQSLAMQHMDLKQVELDTAVAKVDELSRQLESLWTDGPGPPPKGPPRDKRDPRWGSGENPAWTGPGRASPAPPALPEPPAPTPPETEAELERLLRGSDAEAAAEGPPEGPPECPPEGPPARPLSPTRLQPLLPPEARRVPEFQEVARVLAEMPRPLKRRGSMEQSPGPAAAPSRARQYRQLITRLLHRPPAPGDGSAEVALSLSPPPAAAAALPWRARRWWHRRWRRPRCR